MSEINYIDKDNKSPFHYDIRQLYQEGIEIIQRYSGNNWTDFNEHDPGVTILEQLVFVITDLCYKMGFDTVDFLVGENGQLDTDRLGLYEADEILVTHPVTLEDYRRKIFDSIPDVSNVWIETIPREMSNGILGLYQIFLYLDPSKYKAFQAEEDDIKKYKERQRQLVLNLWPNIRNIGEDLDESNLIVLDYLEVYIYADLVVRNAGNLEDVLADIVFEIDNYFNPILAISTLEDMLEEGFTYDQIFDGPKLENGFLKPEVLRRNRPTRITKAQLVSIISSIKEVVQIERLQIKYVKDGMPVPAGEVLNIEDIKSNAIPRCKFMDPKNFENDSNKQVMNRSFGQKDEILMIKLKKKNNQKYLNLDYSNFHKTLRRKQALQNRAYASDADSYHKAPLPKGQYRDWSRYYSMQNHFPSIYAINQFGLTRHDSDKRQAMALQLKGYLVLFEQIIVDFQNQMAHLKDLYSTDKAHLFTTYYPKPLLDAEINDIEKLYPFEQSVDDQSKLKPVLEALLKKLNDIHPHISRKSRLLDYMLGLYGEKFAQQTLGRIGQQGTKGNQAHNVLENKLYMLERLRYFNTNTAKAPAMGLSRSPKDISGFEMKLAVLLGINLNTALIPDGSSIFSLYKDKHLRINLVPDQAWEKIAPGKVTNIDKLMLDGRLIPVQAIERKKYQHQDQGIKKNFLIGEKIISTQLGINPQNYYVYQTNRKDRYYLLIKLSTAQGLDWHVIGSCDDPQEALIVLDLIISICKNYQGERFMFIDHIKLRPFTEVNEDEENTSELKDFYTFSATVVFGNWGSKFMEPAYQHLAEDTVMKIIPSHVRVNIMWLNFIKYREFEKLFSLWVNQPQDDNCRANLVHFLKNNSNAN